MKAPDRETNPTRTQTISISGHERAIEGQHSVAGQKLTLLLDRNETAELIFHAIIDDDEEIVDPRPLSASFFCWRLPPARLDEKTFLLPEEIEGLDNVKRDDDPMQYVLANWLVGTMTFQGETKEYCCWCELVMRPRTQADNAHLYAQTPAASAKAEKAKPEDASTVAKLVAHVETVLKVSRLDGNPTRGQMIAEEFCKRLCDGKEPIDVYRDMAREDYTTACKNGAGRWLRKAKALAAHWAYVRGEKPSKAAVETLAQTLKRERNRALAVTVPKPKRTRP